MTTNSGNNGQLAIPYDGSKPLKNNTHERYARFRAQALPRMVAFRKAGNVAKNDCNAEANSFRLDKKPGVRERIEYLTRQAQERIAEKRVALEENLWAVLEANIKDYFETFEVTKTTRAGGVETDETGKMLTVRKQRPKLLSDLPDEIAKLVEDVSVDRHGNVIPKLYSKSQANRGLRELLNLGRTDDRQESTVSLSDAELIAQLSDQANQLGVKIDLSYSFDQQQKPDDEPTEANGELIDTVAQPVAAGGSGADVEEERRIAEAAREMKIAAQPSPQRRHETPAGSRKLQRNRP